MTDKIIRWYFSGYSGGSLHSYNDSIHAKLVALFSLFTVLGFKRGTEDVPPNGFWDSPYITGSQIFTKMPSELKNPDNYIYKFWIGSWHYVEAAQRGPFILQARDVEYRWRYRLKGETSDRYSPSYRSTSINLYHRNGKLVADGLEAYENIFIKHVSSSTFQSSVVRFDSNDEPYFHKETRYRDDYAIRARLIKTEHTAALVPIDQSAESLQGDNFCLAITDALDEDFGRFSFDADEFVKDGKDDTDTTSDDWQYMILRFKLRYDSNPPVIIKRKLSRDGLQRVLKEKGKIESTVSEKKDDVLYLASFDITAKNPESLQGLHISFKNAFAVKDDVRFNIYDKSSYNTSFLKNEQPEKIAAEQDTHDGELYCFLDLRADRLFVIGKWEHFANGTLMSWLPPADSEPADSLSRLIIAVPLIIGPGYDWPRKYYADFVSGELPESGLLIEDVVPVSIIFDEIYFVHNIINSDCPIPFTLDEQDFLLFFKGLSYDHTGYCLKIPEEEEEKSEKEEKDLDEEESDDQSSSGPRADFYPNDENWVELDLTFKFRLEGRPVKLLQESLTRKQVSDHLRLSQNDESYREKTYSIAIDGVTYIAKVHFHGNDHSDLTDFHLSFVSATAVENDVQHDIFPKSSWRVNARSTEEIEVE